MPLNKIVYTYNNQSIEWQGDGIYVNISKAPLDWMVGWYKIYDLETITFNLKIGYEIRYIRKDQLEQCYD